MSFFHSLGLRVSVISFLCSAAIPSSWLELLVWKFTPRSTPAPSCSQVPQSASRHLQTPWCPSLTPRSRARYLSVFHFPSCCWNWNSCFFCRSIFPILKCPCVSSGSEQTMRGGSGNDGTGSKLHHQQKVALWQEALLLRRPSSEFPTSFVHFMWHIWTWGGIRRRWHIVVFNSKLFFGISLRFLHHTASPAGHKL